MDWVCCSSEGPSLVDAYFCEAGHDDLPGPLCLDLKWSVEARRRDFHGKRVRDL